jgi:hypothetical protein
MLLEKIRDLILLPDKPVYILCIDRFIGDRLRKEQANVRGALVLKFIEDTGNLKPRRNLNSVHVRSRRNIARSTSGSPSESRLVLNFSFETIYGCLGDRGLTISAT